jgi:hypothetical protein
MTMTDATFRAPPPTSLGQLLDYLPETVAARYRALTAQIEDAGAAAASRGPLALRRYEADDPAVVGLTKELEAITAERDALNAGGEAR